MPCSAAVASSCTLYMKPPSPETDTTGRSGRATSLIIARKKLVGQRVTLENQIRGLAVVFGVRLPRALSSDFIRQALEASDGIPGLSAAMQGLVAARAAVLAALLAIDADISGWS